MKKIFTFVKNMCVFLQVKSTNLLNQIINFIY